MGIEERKGIIPRCPQNGQNWIRQSGSMDADVTQVLRPNFDITFDNQKCWHKEVVKMVRERGMGFSRGILQQSELDAYTDEQLLRRVEAAFKSARSKYQLQRKDVLQRDVEIGFKRRVGRKARVSINNAI